MMATMVIGSGAVALGIGFGVLPLVMALMSAVYLLLAGLSYLSVKSFAFREQNK
jgi:uncharacterized membrane protein (DUF485 family)